MKIVKEGFIYNLFTEQNQEFIIRKAIRKKKSSLHFIKEERTIEPEDLFTSWRTKKKKPPDKLINIMMFIYRRTVEKKNKKLFGKKRKRRRRELQCENCLVEESNERKNRDCVVFSDVLKKL
jgi:hypothetical protein